MAHRSSLCLGSSSSSSSTCRAPPAHRVPRCRSMQRARRLPLAAAAGPGSGSRTSLVPETLEQLAGDAEQAALMEALKTKGQAALTREEARARRRSLQGLNLPTFAAKLTAEGAAPLRRVACSILQLNIGLFCNQACSHCHVESSPARSEMMERAVADRCLALLSECETVTTLDITGGAPELNSQFRYLVQQTRAQCGPLEIIDRCNLTVLCEPGQEDLPAFLAQHKVRVVASLPCYGADNTDKQRGRGVFERSIQGLQMLNAVGYGQPGSGLQLDLVYNPGGAFLAPSQEKLQPAYKQELKEAYGIDFNSLLALNNMPIKRFADYLIRQGALAEYMQLLVTAFNPAALSGLMCLNTVSVAWDGRLYDCDFNQQLALGLDPDRTGSGSSSSSASSSADGGQLQPPGQAHAGGGLSVWDIDSLGDVTGRLVRTGSHCYGCTAGSGSSCQGATS